MGRRLLPHGQGSRTERDAKTQCSLPYTIAKGPSNGVIMHVADDRKLYELRIKGDAAGRTYLGFAFASITYHDGQSFMVMRDFNVSSALELDRATVCVESGPASQLNLSDSFRSNSMAVEERAFLSAAEALRAFESGQCKVLTRDQSALYSERQRLSRPDDAIILPDIISKEPLGPATHASDFTWFTLVKWVSFALVNAEELGISSWNATEAMAPYKPDIRRFAGLEGGFGRTLGLKDMWALRAVRAAGNDAEIYERNLRVKSRLAIRYGQNQRWSMGGVLYAPPIRSGVGSMATRMVPQMSSIDRRSHHPSWRPSHSD